MLKPSEIIYKIHNNLDILLKHETESGGFEFDQWLKIDNYMGHECFFKIYAKHSNSVSPFKNWVECYVKLSFYPSQRKGKFNDDGYSYHCTYKKYYWGSYHTSDEALLNKLLDTMSNSFDNNDGFFSLEDCNETITLALYKNLPWDSFYL